MKSDKLIRMTNATSKEKLKKLDKIYIGFLGRYINPGGRINLPRTLLFVSNSLILKVTETNQADPKIQLKIHTA